MAYTNPGIHHLSKKARVHEIYGKSFRDKSVKFLDHLMYPLGLIAPVVTIPQAVKIFTLKSAEQISLISWFGYLILASIWMLYGKVHNEKWIVLVNFAWVIVNIMVIIGVFIYG